MKTPFERCNCQFCQYYRLHSGKELPWWRRMTRWDWLFVALCLAGAAACWWVILR